MHRMSHGHSKGMRFALAQLLSTVDPQENLAMVTAAARRAAQGGADVMVCPEATMCSFLRAPTQVAEAFDGPWASTVRRLAETHGITIIAGMFTTTHDGRVHNTLVATGEREGRYDKIHLFDALGHRESETVAPGRRPASIEIAGHSLGLAVCYDVRFPTHFINLALGGATVMVVCASWAPGPGKLHQWRTLVTARAMDSVSFVVAVDQALQGNEETPSGPTGIGHSMVVDPTGQVLLELDAEPDLAFVDIDPDKVAVTRKTFPVLDGNRLRSL